VRENAVQIIDDEAVEPVVASRPPGWMIVAVVVAGIALASFVMSQASTSGEAVDDAGLSSFDEAPLTALAAETPRQLRGYVAVSSLHDQVSMFRPGGSLVSRTDHPQDDTEQYPMLMTGGRLVFSGISGWMFDIDLADGPAMFGTNRSIIPGAEPGIIWFARRSSPAGNYQWVAPVDVESLTVGDRVDITDVFTHPVVGVADGLIVVPIDQDTHGRFAYWSPTDGLAPIGFRDPSQETVVGASGNLVVVALRGGVSIFDISSGDYVSSFPFDFGEAVASACLSPDREHVVVVGSNGEAIVGNTTTGDVMPLKDTDHGEDGKAILVPNQLTHGIGWTAVDQVVFIGEDEDRSHFFGFDIATGESFHIADLPGVGGWWIAANGSMC